MDLNRKISESQWNWTHFGSLKQRRNKRPKEIALVLRTSGDLPKPDQPVKTKSISGAGTARISTVAPLHPKL
jgi:hypothetical protein